MSAAKRGYFAQLRLICGNGRSALPGAESPPVTRFREADAARFALGQRVEGRSQLKGC